MSADWKGLLAKVAPVAASFLGGPLAGAVTQQVSSALLGKSDGSSAELAAALGAPDAVVKLREIELSFEQERNRHGEAVIALDDANTANARARQTATGDNTPSYLAYGVTIGFFGVLAALMLTETNGTMRDVLLVMVGALGSAWGSIINYYFGSSRGSDAKTALLTRTGASG